MSIYIYIYIYNFVIPSRSKLCEELDFRNEALNALRMEELLRESLQPEALERTAPLGLGFRV